MHIRTWAQKCSFQIEGGKLRLRDNSGLQKEGVKTFLFSPICKGSPRDKCGEGQSSWSTSQQELRSVLGRSGYWSISWIKPFLSWTLERDESVSFGVTSLIYVEDGKAGGWTICWGTDVWGGMHPCFLHYTQFLSICYYRGGVMKQFGQDPISVLIIFIFGFVCFEEVDSSQPKSQ